MNLVVSSWESLNTNYKGGISWPLIVMLVKSLPEAIFRSGLTKLKQVKEKLNNVLTNGAKKIWNLLNFFEKETMLVNK